MTDQTRFHRHWTLKVGPRAARFLRKPRRHTYNHDKAEQSRFVWGPCPMHPEHNGLFQCYTLSILGVLHALTGVVLEWPDE